MLRNVLSLEESSTLPSGVAAGGGVETEGVETARLATDGVGECLAVDPDDADSIALLRKKRSLQANEMKGRGRAG